MSDIKREDNKVLHVLSKGEARSIIQDVLHMLQLLPGKGPHLPAYIGGNLDNFEPHEWVVHAVQTAYQEGQKRQLEAEGTKAKESDMSHGVVLYQGRIVLVKRMPDGTVKPMDVDSLAIPVEWKAAIYDLIVK